MKTNCPFIYCKFSISDNLAKVKPFDIRITCYEDKCPSEMWEPLVCINPNVPEDSRRYLGGHCKFITNICENCKDLHKCKKSGDNKSSCRQETIDMIFRVQDPPVTTEPKPVHKSVSKAEVVEKEV
jgi:hypothetical protein